MAGKASGDSRTTDQSSVLRILRSFRRIVRAVDLDSRQLITQYGITGPQLLCLTNIVEREQLSAAELARTVHLSPSTVVGILDRLEQKGLILRSRDSQDRRIVNTLPTAQGRHLVEQAPSPLHQTLTKALERQTELEQATMALALERIVGLIDASQIDAAPMLETGENIAASPTTTASGIDGELEIDVSPRAQ